ncbi:hypothetical protein LINGRAHAP2_LOCUS15859 [Linum grandiflorum]
MQVGEVMTLLCMTQRWESRVHETMEQYIAQWKLRDYHVAEAGIVGDPERWHFHNQYMDWYRGFNRR